MNNYEESNMKKNKLVWTGVLALTLLCLPHFVGAAPLQQGGNLLQNPSFEGSYSAWNGIPQAQMPAGWTPWWADNSGDDPDWANHRPEWKPAEAEHFANRVHSGSRAIQWFKSYATYNAGAYQQVNVSGNARLKFSAYGQAWSCDEWKKCQDASSHDPANMSMRIGIDPTGGANPWSPSIVWSGYGNPLDAWGYFEVEATAQGSVVTVFLQSHPDWPKQNQDSYFDDASLVVVGDAPAPAAQPQAAAVVAAPPAASFATATPRPDGAIFHTVGAGDTEWTIAARYGITLDELKANNNIGAFIYAGQELFIRTVEPPAPTPVPTAVATASPVPEPVEETEPAEAVGAADSQTRAGGTVCVTAFNDQNGNGFRDAGEGLLAGVLVTVYNAQQVLGTYSTDGVSEPYCFDGLVDGNYRITQIAEDDWVATTLAAWGISLRAGDVHNLEFGNVAFLPGAPAAAGAETAAEGTVSAGEQTTWAKVRSSVFAGVGVLGLLLVMGVGLLVMLPRRRA